MIEPDRKLIELGKKIREVGENIRILWSKTGIVSKIDGLITIPLQEDIEDSVRQFLMKYRVMSRERSTMLLLESHFFLNPLSKFIDGADAIITANTYLFAGKDDEKIRAVFIKRGIL